MSAFNRSLTIAALFIFAVESYADATVAATTVVGPFSGLDAAVDPANSEPHQIAWYGTDLGFTYSHEGRLHFLFGDSWAIESYAPIEASSGSRFDDGFGSVALEDWPDPSLIGPDNIPALLMGQNSGTTEAAAIDPGYAMDLGKTPMGGFSNGQREFGIFNTTKPQGCRTEADCDNGLSCDQGLGYLGVPYAADESLTLPCVEGRPFCAADTMVDTSGDPLADSGFCSDPGSSIWADTDAGRTAGIALRQGISLRNQSNPKRYADIYRWLTNRFVNMTPRVVNNFMFPEGTVVNSSDVNGRVFLWGRPGFIGVGAAGRTMSLYFAWVDMPVAPNFEWRLNYYSGSRGGVPQFSSNEMDAAAVDLDSTQPGVQSAEVHDLVQQMSVVWVSHLNKWVMFYGGGIINLPQPALPECGVLQLFTGYDCKRVVVGNGAIHMRTADQPWGPWSPPQDVIVGGDPAIPGSGQYGVNGVLHHPGCVVEGCAPHTRTVHYHDDEYGFFYSANIIEEWITPVGKGVDILWNASTWDPYRVVLLRTHIAP